MKKIIWPVGNVSEARYDIRIGRELQKKIDVDILFITDFKPSEIILEKEVVRFKSLRQLFIEADNNIPHEPDTLIAQANDVLDQIDINMVVHGDQIIEKLLKPHNARILAAKTILAYDWLYRQENFDAVIRYGGNSLNFWIPSIIAEKYGHPSYIFNYAGFFERGVTQFGGIREQWDWLSFHRAWEKWQNLTVSSEDKKEIDVMVDKYINQHTNAIKSRMIYVMENKKSQKLSQKIKYRFQKLKQNFRSSPSISIDNEANYLNSPDVHQLEIPFERMMQLKQEQWECGYKNFSYDPIPKKYIYMPLGNQHDAPHCSWNPMNYLQEYTVEVVLKSLPIGYDLLIKEHPYSRGFPAHVELARLQKHGVKVAHPKQHSLELIRNASALFCQGDTSGWEAILLKTPLVIYGAHPFYSAYPLSQNVSDPNQVHYALRKALGINPLLTQQDEWRYRFIQSVLKSSFDCNIWGYKGLIWSQPDHSDHNVERIANMLKHEMEIPYPGSPVYQAARWNSFS